MHISPVPLQNKSKYEEAATTSHLQSSGGWGKESNTVYKINKCNMVLQQRLYTYLVRLYTYLATRTHARPHACTHTCTHTRAHTRAHTHTHLLNSLRRIQVHQKNLQCIRTHNRKDSWSVKVIPTYLPMYVRNLYVSTCNTLHTYICTTCYCSTHTHSTHNNHMHTYTAPSHNPHTANKSNEIVSGHTVVDTPHTYSHRIQLPVITKQGETNSTPTLIKALPPSGLHLYTYRLHLHCR